MTDNNQSALVVRRDAKVGGDSKAVEALQACIGTETSASGTDIDDPKLLQESVSAIMKGVVDAVSELRKLVQLGEMLKPWASAVSKAQESSDASYQVEDSPSIASNQIIPSATNPGPTASVQPAATKLAATKPAVTKPTATKPAATKTAATKPTAIQPAASQPAAGQPAATKPTVSQPAISQPAVSQPAASQPAATQPVSATLTEMRSTNVRLQEDLIRSQQRTSLLEKELAQERNKLRMEMKTSDSLREAMLKGTYKPKVLEQDVTAKFRDLRTMIEHIARSKKMISVEQDTSAEIFKSTREKGPRLTVDDRKKRIQSRIFEILCSHILNRRCFGLDGYQIKGSSADFELAFDNFEYALLVVEKGKMPSSVISDWRIATLACAETLKVPSTKPDTVACVIMALLKPFIVQPPTTRKPEASEGLERTPTLYDRVLELCEKALELALTMRRSDGEYMCYMPEVNVPLSKNQDLAQEVSVEGGGSSNNDLVAFTICGALLKKPKGMAGKHIILEQALVVLQGK